MSSPPPRMRFGLNRLQNITASGRSRKKVTCAVLSALILAYSCHHIALIIIDVVRFTGITIISASARPLPSASLLKLDSMSFVPGQQYKKNERDASYDSLWFISVLGPGAEPCRRQLDPHRARRRPGRVRLGLMFFVEVFLSNV